jgi:hypothetical protein
MEQTIQDKFELYVKINKEIAEFRRKQAGQKKLLTNLEQEIQQYMIDNQLDSVSLKEGQIVLFEAKTSGTFKRDTMVDLLTEKLKDEKKAESIVESIISNKVFTITQKVKINLKKK